jgi:hypothetical protein
MRFNLQTIVESPIVDIFKKTPGAVSVCEGLGIYYAVSSHLLPHGHRIDLGSHAGKSSTFAVAALARQIGNSEFTMLDPVYDLYNLEAWSQTVQLAPDHVPWSYVHDREFKNDILKRMEVISGGIVKVNLVGDISMNHLPKLEGDFSYVFIDSDDHQPDLVNWEVDFLKDRMAPGGIILFHDFANQYHAPREAAERLVKEGNYNFIDIPWGEIKEAVAAKKLEEGNESWHMPCDPLPCFVGGVIRK